MKLALGTVQFGLSYGVANTSGQTPRNEVARIVERAKKFGLDTLDTAAAYGESEQVLGDIGVAEWKVVTKIPTCGSIVRDRRNWVLEQVQRSMAALRVERLDAILLHNAADLLQEYGAEIVAGLQAAKANGLVSKVGYSIYSPQPLTELVEIMVPDLVQAPLNVFDQRLVRSGWLDRLVEAGVEVHIRSVFMQGLLLMNHENRPKFFEKWPELWQRWDTAVGGNRDRALALCLGFAKAQPAISRIVVGVESLAHFEHLLSIWKKAAPFDAGGFACDAPELVDPSNWKPT